MDSRVGAGAGDVDDVGLDNAAGGWGAGARWLGGLLVLLLEKVKELRRGERVRCDAMRWGGGGEESTYLKGGDDALEGSHAPRAA